MPTTMQLIAKQTIGAGGAASVTFSSIPQTFTDIKVVVSVRGTYVGPGNSHSISFNGSSANFTGRLIQGNGASASSGTTTQYVGDIAAASSTANTFNNAEFYIPNYTGSNNKSISVDSVTENNATTAYATLVAVLWSNTAAINSITLTNDTGNYVEFSEFTLYGISNSTTTQNPTTPSAIGGDVITTDGSFWYHAFKYSGSFTPLKNLTADVLVVAGGGGGGQNYGSGGGAGGLQALTAQALTSATNYTCTVGAGGVCAASNGRGFQGSNSQFGALTASLGGGAGGGNASGQYNGAAGGSGGGGGGVSTPSTGGAGTPGQGNAGGNQTGVGAGSGGGGAGAAGSGADAGIGATSSLINAMGSATTTGELSGGNYYFAGGGLSYSAGVRGLGGGAPLQGSGTPNTGGGGGGDGGSSKSGGSGIVIVRYAV